MQACEEVASGFFVAGGDATELFDKIEEAFDQIAFGVEGEVAMARDLAIRFWRNDRLDGPHFEGLDKGVDVVALVGEESFGPHFGGERLGLVDVVDMPAGEAERQWISDGVHDHMDFGGQPAARAAYGLVEAPFLRAPALC
jgi:hypothetical protein